MARFSDYCFLLLLTIFLSVTITTNGYAQAPTPSDQNEGSEIIDLDNLTPYTPQATENFPSTTSNNTAAPPALISPAYDAPSSDDVFRSDSIIPTTPLDESAIFTWGNSVASSAGKPPVIPTSNTEGLIISIKGDAPEAATIDNNIDEIDIELVEDEEEKKESVDYSKLIAKAPPFKNYAAIIERRPGGDPALRQFYNPDITRPEFNYTTNQIDDIFSPEQFGTRNHHLSGPLYREQLYRDFFKAAQNNNLPGLKGLLTSRHISDINMQDANGDTALIHAAKNSHVTIMRYLLANEADPNIANSQGVTALHVAAMSLKENMIKLLLNHDANLLQEDQSGYVAFDYALAHGYYGLLDFLYAPEMNLDRHLANGSTLLIEAIRQNDQQKLRYLVKKGASIEQKEKNGYTPLMLAAFNNRMYMVDYLLAKGADIEAKDDEGRTAYELADMAGNRPIFTRIMSHYMRMQLAANGIIAPSSNNLDSTSSSDQLQLLDNHSPAQAPSLDDVPL